tara:strand:- start:4569 stop:5144 length:576 start_codon:yes stop_codon:yes gene_type:complete
MPQQLDIAIREMCGDTMAQTVAALAEKYNFDVDEANRFLDTTPIKIVRKRGPSSKKEKETNSAGKSKKETSNDTSKTKRGKTGYLLYGDEMRPKIQQKLLAELEEGDKLKPQAVVVAIAAAWKGEDQEVRDQWNTKAKAIKESSDDEMVIANEPEPVINASKEKKKVSKKAPKKVQTPPSSDDDQEDSDEE